MSKERKRTGQTIKKEKSVDQAFLDAFNPTFTIQVQGKQITCRTLDIGHYSELRTQFPDGWDGFNLAQLMNAHAGKALHAICWLGIRGLNDAITSKEQLTVAINGHTFVSWGAAWRRMAGGSEDEGADDTEEDSPTQPNQGGSETGDTS